MLTAMLGSLAIVVLAGYFLARDRALVKVRLREARHAAEQSSRAKAVFLRSMSQEFRAPLGAILGEATNLQVRLPADAAEQQSLQGIVTAGNYLGDLLNQLLEVSRAEADETLLRIEPVPVSQIVAPCLAIVGPEAVRREVVVEDICGELAERKVWGRPGAGAAGGAQPPDQRGQVQSPPGSGVRLVQAGQHGFPAYRGDR
jgi:signal transduction histidine kinase